MSNVGRTCGSGYTTMKNLQRLRPITSGGASRSALLSTVPDRYASVRAATLALAAPLSDEDCAIQSMPDASPVKWHLAHTSWFFETFVLAKHRPGYRVFDPAYRVLFNSYYHAVGERHPRPERGMLPRPALADVLAARP